MKHAPLLAVLALLALPGCFIYPVTGMRVEAGEIVPQAPARQPREQPRPGPWAELRLTSPDDLSRFRRWYDANIWVKVSACTDGRFDPLRRLGTGGVSDALRSATSRLDNGENQPPDPTGRFTYFVHAVLRTSAYFAHGTDRSEAFIDHDLRERPDDVCLLFGGGLIGGGRHRSDTVRIPYALIAAALARAGLPHAAPP